MKLVPLVLWALVQRIQLIQQAISELKVHSVVLRKEFLTKVKDAFFMTK